MGSHRGVVQRRASGITDSAPNDSDSAPDAPTSLADIARAPEVAATLGAAERRVVRICLTVLAILGTGSLVGVAFSLYLVEEAPLLLIGLSPLGRHFVLVAPLVDPVAYLAVGITRRIAFYVPCYFLGRSLGPVALVWLEARARRFAAWVRFTERIFERGGHVVILLGAGPTTSTLAGIAKMRLPVFIVLAVLSLFFRLVLMYELAEVFREPLEELLAWIEQYRLPGTIALIAAIAGWQIVKRRRARAG